MKLNKVFAVVFILVVLAFGENFMKEVHAAEPAKEKKIKYYRNPMDPAMRSDKPTKDSMGMDYVPVYEENVETTKSNIDDLGRGSFSITPEQMKLSGSKITRVEKRDIVREVRVPGRALEGTHVSFQTYESDLSFIKVGMSFSANTPSIPGETFRGKISSIDSILDPMTRTVRVDGIITNMGKTNLKVESTMIGTFEIRIPQVLTIPRDSVIHVGSRDLVYVFDGKNEFSPREVMLGGKAQDWYEVKSGLREGEEISAGPNFLLDSESRIQFHD